MASASGTVFPEDLGTGLASMDDADFTSAGHFGGLAAAGATTEYVENGLDFTYDSANDSLDIASGQVRLLFDSPVDIQDASGDYSKTWDSGIGIVVDVDAVTGVAATGGDDVYLIVDLDNGPNDISYEGRTTEPSAPFLRVGEISGSTAIEVNRGHRGVPSGGIMMWSGATVPTGWTLCDGSDGAPDMRNQFVVGSGDTYSIGDTGGASSVTLSTSEIPSHDHGDGSLDVDSHDHGDGTLSTSSDGSHTHGVSGGDFVTTGSSDSVSTQSSDFIAYQGFESATDSAGSHSHGVSGSTGSSSPGVHGSTGNTGGGNSHENRPPFYALAFIMKK